MSDFFCVACVNAYVSDSNIIFRTGAYVEGEMLYISNASRYVRRYAPKVTRDNGTMVTLYKIQAQEIQKILGTARGIMKNDFFQTMDGTALQKWEKTMRLDNFSTADLQSRRDLALTKRRLKIPFTKLNLYELMKEQWQGNFTMEIDYENYIVWVDVETNYPRVYLKHKKYVRDIIPANMALYMCVQYTYVYLKKKLTYGECTTNPLYRYGELSKYRYVEGA